MQRTSTQQRTRTQHGIALIIVLIFLEIFTLLGLSALQANIWETRMARNVWEKNLLMSAAEQELTQAAMQLQQHPLPCMIPITTSANLLAAPLPWWQSVSCAGNFQLLQYYYVVEFMGNDSCAIVSGAVPHAAAMTADYYRISLLMTSATTPGMQTLMQQTLVKPITITKVCDGKSHRVATGRQSQRVLI